MIFPFINEAYMNERAIFDCISIPELAYQEPERIEILDYVISNVSRFEHHYTFNFLLNNVNNPISISDQTIVVEFALHIFADSRNLSIKENEILNDIYEKHLQLHPTLPRRK